MSIQEIYGNFKRFLTSRDAPLALLILIVGIGSFFLGRLSVSSDFGRAGQVFTASQEPAVVIHARTDRGDSLNAGDIGTTTVSTQSTPPSQSEGGYVASKNGTKYHLPWCGSAKQIKEENKIWFATKADAEAAGYTPASNCKGI